MSESDADKTFRTKSLVDRRDFVNGVAMTIGASLFPFRELLGQESSPDSSAQEYFLSKGITPQDPRYYPPALTGMRGSHPGSFEAAHGLRDGKASHDVIDTEEDYDMVVVGGGISGLASAYFYRKSAGPQARILILDNHDDFGGHAKRNEFQAGNRLLLGYGGTQSIEAPGHYSKESIGLLKELGIDTQRFYKYYDQKLFPDADHGSRAQGYFAPTDGVDRLLSESGSQPNARKADEDELQRFPFAVRESPSRCCQGFSIIYS